MSALRNERIRLPLHLKWSGPREYDLSDPKDRLRVYEVVLREGRAEDIRRFIDPDEVLRLWNELVLPDRVRAAWADYALRFVLEKNGVPSIYSQGPASLYLSNASGFCYNNGK